MKRIIHRASENCGIIKKDLTLVSLGSQEKKKEDKVEKILKEIVTENFLKLAKNVAFNSESWVNIKQNKPIEIYTKILQS